MDRSKYLYANKAALIRFAKTKQIIFDDFTPKVDVVNELLLKKYKYNEFKIFMKYIDTSIIKKINATNISKNVSKHDSNCDNIRKCESVPVVINLLAKYQKAKYKVHSDEYKGIWYHWQHIFQTHLLQLKDKMKNYHYIHGLLLKKCVCKNTCIPFTRSIENKQQARAITIRMDGIHMYLLHSYDMRMKINPNYVYESLSRLKTYLIQRKQPPGIVTKFMDWMMANDHDTDTLRWSINDYNENDIKNDGDPYTIAINLFPHSGGVLIKKFFEPDDYDDYCDDEKNHDLKIKVIGQLLKREFDKEKNKLDTPPVKSKRFIFGNYEYRASLSKLKKYLMQKKQPPHIVTEFMDWMTTNDYDTDTLRLSINDYNERDCDEKDRDDIKNDRDPYTMAINLFPHSGSVLVKRFFERPSEYEYGFRFYYWEWFKGRYDGPDDIAGIVCAADDKIIRHRYADLYVDAKYQDLKTEMLNYSTWTKKHWKDKYIRCEGFQKNDKTSRYLKSMQASGPLCVNYKIRAGSPVPFQNVLSLIIYTDSEQYSNDFCGSFRRCYKDEPIQSVKEVNKEYAVAAKLLRELVELFGDAPKKKKRYYRGVNHNFIYTGFIPYINAPASTTRSVTKAQNFAGGGFVITLKRYDDNLRCFDASIFSAHAGEEETLFFGGYSRCQLASVSPGKNLASIKYGSPQCKALGVINRIVCERELVGQISKKTYRYVNNIFTSNYQQNSKQFPPYFVDLIEGFLEEQKILKLKVSYWGKLSDEIKNYLMKGTQCLVQYAKLNELFPNTRIIHCDYASITSVATKEYIDNGDGTTSVKNNWYPWIQNISQQIQAISNLNYSQVRKIQLFFDTAVLDEVRIPMKSIESQLSQLNFILKCDQYGIKLVRSIFN